MGEENRNRVEEIEKRIKEYEDLVKKRKEETLEKDIFKKARTIGIYLDGTWRHYNDSLLLISPVYGVTVKVRQGRFKKETVYKADSDGNTLVYKPSDIWEKHLDEIYKIALVKKAKYDAKEKEKELKRKMKQLESKYNLDIKRDGDGSE